MEIQAPKRSIEEQVKEYCKTHNTDVVRQRGRMFAFANGKVISFSDKPSKTIQSAKEDCDINRILKKFAETGTLTHVNRSPLAFRDTVGDLDYKEAQTAYYTAKEAFAQLPSKIRNRFMNDPGQLIEFLADPANDAEAVALKLKKHIPAPKNEVAEELRSLHKTLKPKPKPAPAETE